MNENDSSILDYVSAHFTRVPIEQHGKDQGKPIKHGKLICEDGGQYPCEGMCDSPCSGYRGRIGDGYCLCEGEKTPFRNFHILDDGKVPKTITELIEELVDRCGGYPFAFGPDRILFFDWQDKIHICKTCSSLFALLKQINGICEMKQGMGYVTKRELFWGLRFVVYCFDSLEQYKREKVKKCGPFEELEEAIKNLKEHAKQPHKYLYYNVKQMEGLVEALKRAYETW